MTVVYVSHPIKGLSENQKRALEFKAKQWCDFRDFVPLLPRTIAPGCVGAVEKCKPDDSAGEGAEHTHACYMRGDLTVMCREADVILLMPGWEKSVGCRAELNAALACGIHVEIYNVYGGVKLS